MKSVKPSNYDQEMFPVQANPNSQNKIYRYNQRLSLISNIPQHKGFCDRTIKMIFTIDHSFKFGKLSIKQNLKKLKFVDELHLTIQQNFGKIHELLFIIANVRIRKLYVTFEHFTLFKIQRLRKILSHFCTKNVIKFGFTIKHPVDLIDMLISISLDQTSLFNNKHFNVLIKQISGLPCLKHLTISFNSQNIVSVTGNILNSLGSAIRRLRNLSSLNFKMNIKEMTDANINNFSKSLSQKSNMSSLYFSVSGLRKVCPEAFLISISNLTNLKALFLDIDCGWSEPTLQTFADCCSQLVNLETFQMSYAPISRMPYNPLFNESFKRLTNLQTVILRLSGLSEEEAFELSYVLQFLTDLKRVELNFFNVTFSQKSAKRFGDSLMKLEKMQYLSLKFSHCKIQSNFVKGILASVGALKNLLQLSLHILNCNDMEDERFISKLLESLKIAPLLVSFDLKLSGDVNLNILEDLPLLTNFIQEHKDLKVFTVDVPEAAFAGITEQDLKRFARDNRASMFKAFALTHNEQFLFEKKGLTAE